MKFLGFQIYIQLRFSHDFAGHHYNSAACGLESRSNTYHWPQVQYQHHVSLFTLCNSVYGVLMFFLLQNIRDAQNG